MYTKPPAFPPTVPVITNSDARRLFMERHGLSRQPGSAINKAGLQALIDQLGFVQLDSINIVARAHHMILFARSQSYHPKMLKRLLEKDRSSFENWTHDAAVIPTRFYPYWQRHFVRLAPRLVARWRDWREGDFEAMFHKVLSHVGENGPTRSRDMGSGEAKSSGGWWDWHPSKTALEYLWRTGKLAVAAREGFQKVYDLTEKVIPSEHRDADIDDKALIDWCCHEALKRLGFATSGELAAFWDVVSPAEAKAWCADHLGKDLIEVDIMSSDGSKPRRAFAATDILDVIASAPAPPARMRVLSPFDPALRDRKRAERLFDFSYRIEVFVPAPKRQYGYYVFPILEGDRLMGRIDMKRQGEALSVTALWPEKNVKWGIGRMKLLEAELERQRRFIGAETVRFCDSWLREALN